MSQNSIFKNLWSLLCSSAVLMLLSSCGEKEKNIKPEYRELVVSVYAPALVQPAKLYSLYPESGGTIIELAVEEGDTVSPGQLIARIEADRQSYDVESARLQRSLVEEKLKGNNSELKLLEFDIQKLKSEFQLDSVNYFRQKSLWTKDIGSKSELDRLELKYSITRENLKSAKERRKQIEIELENRLRQADVALDKSRSVLGNFKVSAREKGRIYTLNKEQGESINQQEFLAEIGAIDSFIVELQVDEQDIASVRIGQDVVVNLDAYASKNFEAEIRRIYPSKNIRTQSFKLEAAFINAPEKLYAGLAGEANIITSRLEHVLVVPLDYLIDGKKVKTKNGEIDVQTGYRNMQYIEVTEGIDTSTVLLKPD